MARTSQELPGSGPAAEEGGVGWGGVGHSLGPGPGTTSRLMLRKLQH